MGPPAGTIACFLQSRRALPSPDPPVAVNRYINPASDLNCGSGDRLRLDWEHPQRTAVLPLLSAQLGIWFAQKLNGSSSAYKIGEYIEIEGPIDPGLFEEALQQRGLEKDTLRGQFQKHLGEPRQILGALPSWSMPFVDLTAASDPSAEAQAWMQEDLSQPIEPTRGPLFSFALLKVSSDRFFWYASYHHII